MSPPRLWCHLYLNRRHMDFPLPKLIIRGPGMNVRGIAESTDTKIRIRGRGSDHQEKDGKEANIPLMLVVTSDASNWKGFLEGVGMMTRKLEAIVPKFAMFCREKGLGDNKPLWAFGDMSIEAEQLLSTSGLLSGPVHRKSRFPPPTSSAGNRRDTRLPQHYPMYPAYVSLDVPLLPGLVPSSSKDCNYWEADCRCFKPTEILLGAIEGAYALQ